MNKEKILDDLNKVSCFLSIVSCLSMNEVDMESLIRLSLDYKDIIDDISEVIDQYDI